MDLQTSDRTIHVFRKAWVRMPALEQTLLVLIMSLVIALPACTSKANNAPIQPGKQIQATTKEHSPGAIATSPDGYFMTAKIGGKDWTAAYMVPDNDVRSNDKQIQREDSEVTINSIIWKPGLKVGLKKEFSESRAANLFKGEEIYGGRKGEFEITKADEQSIEGRFHFTANTSASNKIIEVTDGSFRVPVTSERSR